MYMSCDPYRKKANLYGRNMDTRKNQICMYLPDHRTQNKMNLYVWIRNFVTHTKKSKSVYQKMTKITWPSTVTIILSTISHNDQYPEHRL